MRIRCKEDRKDHFLLTFREKLVTVSSKLTQSINDNEAIEIIISLYTSAAEAMTKRFKPSKPNDQPPWWDRECQELKQRKYSLLRKFRLSNLNADFRLYKQARKEFKQKFKQNKQLYQKDRRQELLQAWKDPRKFWRIVKGSNQSAESSKIKRFEWQEYFRSLLYCENAADIDSVDDTEFEAAASANILNEEISLSKVLSSIKQLKLGKSSGPDCIGAEFYLNTSSEISPVLKNLFNNILNSGNFPPAWGRSIICPIHKSGSVSDPSNFRGIALMNTMYKLFSIILNNRLYKWAEENSKLDEAQAGFRSGYSVVDNIFSLSACVQKYLSRRGGRFYCLYVDLQKAFDNIQHQKLFISLLQKGIHGKFLNILKAMYSNLSASVRTDCGQTCVFPCNVGTRQGDVSSPLIFALFINDLCTLLREQCGDGIFITPDVADIFCLMYADDIANCAETRVRLQRQVNLIGEFCDSRDLKVNLNKTEIIVFRNGGPLRDYERWNLNGTPIRTTSEYKYMGLIFTPKLSWSKAKRKLAAQARKASFCIRNYQRKFGYFKHEEIFRLFDAMVKPILCFGSEIWGNEHSNVIESVHNEFCRYFLGVNSSVNNAVALGECGRLPLCVTYITNCIKYWCKLLCMGNHRYPKNCYKMLKSLYEAGRNTWASNVRSLLYMYGFGYAWIAQEIGNEKIFVSQFKVRLTDCMKQNWHSDINESSAVTHITNLKRSLTLKDICPWTCNFIYARLLRDSVHQVTN